MDGHLRTLLIIAVIVSYIFSCSAQNAASSEDDVSKDAHISVICIPGTTLCNQPHIASVVTKSTEESVGEDDATEFEPMTICNPITHVCKGPPASKSVVADSPVVESSGEVDASKSEFSTRSDCDPETGKCKGPNPNSFLDGSLIHGEEEKISPLVCDPHKGTCQDPHHDFGIAQPRNI